MVDHLTPERRSWNMSRIRSKDTSPEMTVRSLLHRLGYRFRLHGRVSQRGHSKGRLPGNPDLVLAKHRTVVRECELRKEPSRYPDAAVPASQLSANSRHNL